MGYILVAIMSYFLGIFAFSNIIGIIFFKVTKKEYATIIKLILWSAGLFGYYFLIYSNFNAYFITVLIFLAISLVVILANIKSLKKEAN